MAADRLARELLGIATGEDVADSVRLAATKDALDRAGLGAKQSVEVEVGPSKPFEDVLVAAITGGSRAESRAARGIVEPEAAPRDWVDAEIVNADIVDEAPESQPRSDHTTAPEPVSAHPPGMMPIEDALEQLRATAPPPAPHAQRRNRH